ncbi:MAG: CrcB family protein [Pseudomonadota bacterium]
MSALPHWLVVAAGGALGASARHGVGRLAFHAFGPGYPWGTVIANVAGSTLMGLFIGALAARSGTPEGARLFFAVGFLGAFTTMSTFSLDVVTLFERKAYASAAGYASLSLLGSVGGLVLGLAAARLLARGLS